MAPLPTQADVWHPLPCRRKCKIRGICVPQRCRTEPREMGRRWRWRRSSGGLRGRSLLGGGGSARSRPGSSHEVDVDTVDGGIDGIAEVVEVVAVPDGGVPVNVVLAVTDGRVCHCRYGCIQSAGCSMRPISREILLASRWESAPELWRVATHVQAVQCSSAGSEVCGGGGGGGGGEQKRAVTTTSARCACSTEAPGSPRRTSPSSPSRGRSPGRGGRTS